MITVSSEVPCSGKCPEWPARKFLVPAADFFRAENICLLKPQIMVF